MCCSVLPPEMVVHDEYIGGHFRQTKITHKASDLAENLQLYRVVQFFHPKSTCKRTHISADIQRIILNASCMTISGGRTKQLDIFCCITGFTSDLFSFIVVELIWFFHRALQLSVWSQTRPPPVAEPCTDFLHACSCMHPQILRLITVIIIQTIKRPSA